MSRRTARASNLYGTGGARGGFFVSTQRPAAMRSARWRAQRVVAQIASMTSGTIRPVQPGNHRLLQMFRFLRFPSSWRDRRMGMEKSADARIRYAVCQPIVVYVRIRIIASANARRSLIGINGTAIVKILWKLIPMSSHRLLLLATLSFLSRYSDHARISNPSFPYAPLA